MTKTTGLTQTGRRRGTEIRVHDVSSAAIRVGEDEVWGDEARSVGILPFLAPASHACILLGVAK